MKSDPLTREQRSERMSRIRNVDTGIELEVRRMVYRMGYRYRLYGKGLPGRPDIVFRNRKKVVFVHGCFWHQHGCGRYRMPKSRLKFWLPKLRINRARDQKVIRQLRKMGWKALIIWECQVKDQKTVSEMARKFLGRRIVDA